MFQATHDQPEFSEGSTIGEITLKSAILVHYNWALSVRVATFAYHVNFVMERSPLEVVGRCCQNVRLIGRVLPLID